MKAQIVSENVRFERGRKPQEAMDVGIRRNIREWMNWVYGNFTMIEGEDYKINQDYTIDLLGNFEVPDKEIGEFPEYINFRMITGDFMIDYCNMKSLRGCPDKVDGFFSCEGNKLMSLDHMPTNIRDNIFVRDNPGHFIFDQVLAKIGNLKKYQKIYAEDSHINEAIGFKRVGPGGDKSDAFGSIGVGKAAVTMPFGKHRGKDLYDLYEEDPKYVLWLAKEMAPRNAAQESILKIAKELEKKYYKQAEEEGREYFGVKGDWFQGVVKINNAKFSSGEWGDAYSIQAENEDHLFRFYINLKQLAKGLNIKVTYGEHHTYSTGMLISDETEADISAAMHDIIGKKVEIKGKVKYHKEFLGRKWTTLNYVKLLNVINESVRFERGKNPKEVLGLGIYGIVDAEAKELGLDQKATIPIAAGDYGGDIGKVHQWQDKYGANAIVLTDRDGEELEMDVTNSEEDYIRMVGIDEIVEFIESEGLKRFINLE